MDIATLVLTKNIVEKHYHGGVKQFKIDFRFNEVETFEEDNELLALSQMDFRDIDSGKMVKNGIPNEQFDENNLNRETTFCSKYGGAINKPNCFDFNEIFIWHKACKRESIIKAQYHGESTIQKLQELFDMGINPFDTFS